MTRPGADLCQALVEALNHVTAAIAILDQESAPAHIAAHLDLAGHLLRQKIALAPLSHVSDIDRATRSLP